MNYLQFHLLILLCLSAGITLSSMSREEETEHPNWEHYKKWTSYFYWKQDQSNFQVWLNSLQEIQAHNDRFQEGLESYSKAMNEFSDQPIDQLMAQLMPAVRLSEFYQGRTPVQFKEEEVPRAVDWSREHQGSPHLPLRIDSSGWVFSVTRSVETTLERNTGQKVRLSGKELINCTTYPSNRHPITLDAFNYILKNGVLSYLSYRRKPHYKDLKCKRLKNDPVFRISGFHLLEPEDQTNLKIAVALVGPISVSIKVTENFFAYRHGVFYDTLCQDDGEEPNHAVVLVGYGTDPDFGEYWKIQNSWGPGWGENGYARMARNTIINCAIPSAAFYAFV